MKHFTSIQDVANPNDLIAPALEIKKTPYSTSQLGMHKTLGLIFFNSSLRTRLSTQKAAQNLGMDVIVMNVSSDGWALEMEDGTVMNGNTAEHIKEAAAVMGQYCDILGVRTFAGLKDRKYDYEEVILNKFKQYANCPILSLESATLHPLQSLADMVTIQELKPNNKSVKSWTRPKVVLTWAPHPKALPQAVANSFCEWITKQDVEFVLTHPENYELAESFSGNAKIEYNQNKAFENADFIYAKNWSSYHNYGQVLSNDESWMITKEKMSFTNNAKFMHCLPVRRNVVVSDDVIDSNNSIVIQQAGNRVFAAQAVLKELLKSIEKNGQ